MMLKFLIGLFLTCICTLSAQEEDWLLKAQKIDEEAIKWLKGHLKERLNSENFLKNPLDEDKPHSHSNNCKNCISEHLSLEEPSSLYVFMSFSLEDSLWIQFSKELEKIGGTFVLRGLPQNSFKELANRIFDLQDKGVIVPIQIHPKLFQEYEVEIVPSIVVVEENQYDKISGNLSIQCALEKMSQRGETNQAKILYQKSRTLEKE